MSMNDRSAMLADSLLEKGGDVDLNEELPRVAENLRYVKGPEDFETFWGLGGVLFTFLTALSLLPPSQHPPVGCTPPAPRGCCKLPRP